MPEFAFDFFKLNLEEFLIYSKDRGYHHSHREIFFNQGVVQSKLLLNILCIVIPWSQMFIDIISTTDSRWD